MQEIDFSKLPFNVSKWAAWSPAFCNPDHWIQWASEKQPRNPLDLEQQTSPNILFLPIGMRKKLSDLCKLVLFLSHHTLEEKNNVRIVMASRLGEAEFTNELLEAVAKKEMPSPMIFSRSVMNSSLGLFSIFSKNNSSSVCVSAMQDTFQAGLFEALLQVHTYQEPILFLYVEEKILEVTRPYLQDPPVSYGMGFLLEKGEKICSGKIQGLDFLRNVITSQL